MPEAPTATFFSTSAPPRAGRRAGAGVGVAGPPLEMCPRILSSCGGGACQGSRFTPAGPQLLRFVKTSLGSTNSGQRPLRNTERITKPTTYHSTNVTRTSTTSKRTVSLSVGPRRRGSKNMLVTVAATHHDGISNMVSWTSRGERALPPNRTARPARSLTKATIPPRTIGTRSMFISVDSSLESRTVTYEWFASHCPGQVAQTAAVS
jgi:hypothetical protein